jgi:ribose 5-phosphate isomerase RpiB
VGSSAAAQDVVAGRADQAIVCCWTGTGAAIAANKIAGARWFASEPSAEESDRANVAHLAQLDTARLSGESA